MPWVDPLKGLLRVGAPLIRLRSKYILFRGMVEIKRAKIFQIRPANEANTRILKAKTRSRDAVHCPIVSRIIRYPKLEYFQNRRPLNNAESHLEHLVGTESGTESGTNCGGSDDRDKP